MRVRRSHDPIIAVLALTIALASCSKDPDVQAREYLASADKYADSKQYEAAIIEYRNAIKVRPDLAEAHYRLAKVYETSGDPVNAYSSYARAADLEPTNMDAQLKAGALLIAGGEYDMARRRAELAVRADAQNPSAHILLGNALAGLNETSRAIEQMEQAIALDPSYAPAWSALGAARFVGGRREKAGEAFRKAVDLSPASVEPYLALANYQWATGEQTAAEKTLARALAVDGSSPAVHRALALFYIVSKRFAEAEPHFKALVDEPGGVLALADYYTGVGRNDDAISLLQTLVDDPKHPESKAARLRLAAADYQAGRKQQAYALVDAVIKEKPTYADARIAKARMLLLDGGELTEAEEHARKAVESDRTSAAAHYTLGLVALRERDTAAAEKAFREVLRLNPRAGAAQLQLARLQLARGDAAAALSAAEQAARQLPNDQEAAVLVSRSLRAQGDLPRAERELNARIEKTPDAAPLHLELGELLLQRGRAPEARQSFERALQLDPSLHQAKVGLVTVDVAERDLEAAAKRIADWRARAPEDRRLIVLAARVDLVSGRAADAERALRELVSNDASQLDAYDLLGQLYLSQGLADRAIAEYKALAERSNQPAGALTMIGMIYEARGDRDAARKQYEALLADSPRSGVAANNLAWIYAESNRADEAIRLATIAQEELRGRAEPEDTLGWAYYHKGLTGHAIGAFERAIVRSPRNPLYYYHLGLAHAKAGNTDKAHDAFRQALEIKADFAGADDARARLAGGGTN